MKSYILPLALTLGVLAEEAPAVASRDVATVNAAIGQVDTGIQQLDTAVKGFNGDPAQMTDAAQSLVDTIRTATMQVTMTSNLTLADAAGLQTGFSSLQTDGMALVMDLEAKKPDFAMAALCGTVLQATSGISTAAQMLASAIVSKLPVEAQSVGMQLASGLTDVLMQPMMAFSERNCTNGAGMPTGPPGPQSTRPVASFTGASMSMFANATRTGTGGFPSSTGTGVSPASITPFQTGAAVPGAVGGAPGSVGLVVVAVAVMML